MPEATEVTEPVEPTEVETPAAPTAEEIAAWKAASEKLTEFGGDTALDEAKNLRNQLQTDDGVVAMFIESGRALGLGVEKLEGLFGEAEVALNKDAEEQGDKPLTKAEIMAIVQKEVLTPLQQQQAQAAQANARATIDTTVRSLGMDPKADAKDVDLVLRLADKYVGENDFNPERIADAIRKGFDEFGELSAERKAKYVKDKRETKDKVPSSTAGTTSAGAGTQLPEPKNVKEAAARARARLAAGA